MSTAPAEPSSLAQWEVWKRKEMPPVERVREGLWSIPVPIPHNPLRYTITYLSVADDGVLIVDPGWFATETWDALLAGLAVAGAELSDVVGVVVTHMHADHHGLSARVKQETGAWIAMHPAERDALPSSLRETVESSFDHDWLKSSGVPADIAAKLEFTPDAMKPFMDLAQPDLLLADGDFVPHGDRRLRAVWTPGHTPGHICLYDEAKDVLLTGDHVLPRISPTIGMTIGDDDPLSSYVSSLEKIERVRLRGSPARPRIPLPRHRPPHRRPDPASPGAVRRDHAGPALTRRLHHLGDHRTADVVTRLGERPWDHAAQRAGRNRRPPAVHAQTRLG